MSAIYSGTPSSAELPPLPLPVATSPLSPCPPLVPLVSRPWPLPAHHTLHTMYAAREQKSLPAPTSLEAPAAPVVEEQPILRPPPPFEALQNDALRVLNIQCFDGCSFELAKQLSPYFVLRHSIMMGTTMFEEGTKYSFGSDVGDEKGNVMFGRVDHSGQLMATMHKVGRRTDDVYRV